MRFSVSVFFSFFAAVRGAGGSRRVVEVEGGAMDEEVIFVLALDTHVMYLHSDG